MVEDRKRCGWGVVLAAVTLFATLLLTVPAGPATAAPGEGAPVLVRHTPAGGTEARVLVRRLGGGAGGRDPVRDPGPDRAGRPGTQLTRPVTMPGDEAWSRG